MENQEASRFLSFMATFVPGFLPRHPMAGHGFSRCFDGGAEGQGGGILFPPAPGLEYTPGDGRLPPQEMSTGSGPPKPLISKNHSVSPIISPPSGKSFEHSFIFSQICS
jgi:hypothetical protein